MAGLKAAQPSRSFLQALQASSTKRWLIDRYAGTPKLHIWTLCRQNVLRGMAILC